MIRILIKNREKLEYRELKGSSFRITDMYFKNDSRAEYYDPNKIEKNISFKIVTDEDFVYNFNEDIIVKNNGYGNSVSYFSFSILSDKENIFCKTAESFEKWFGEIFNKKLEIFTKVEEMENRKNNISTDFKK